jgi:hypothetical protein
MESKKEIEMSRMLDASPMLQRTVSGTGKSICGSSSPVSRNMCGARKDMATWSLDGSDAEDGGVEVFGKNGWSMPSVRGVG